MLKTYPAITTGLASILGAFIGFVGAWIVQWRIQVSNRKADWRKRRNEAYAKFFGIYFVYVDSINQVTFLNYHYRNDLQQFNQWKRNNPHTADDPYVVRKNRELDESESHRAEILERMHGCMAQMEEAAAIVSMLEKDDDVLKQFDALRINAPTTTDNESP